MKRKTLLPIFIAFITIMNAQDEITNAVNCPDNTPVSASDVVNATASTIGASDCSSETDDAFYYNTISSGDNKITISMVTTVAVVTTINYQILRAPNGDTNNLEEVLCSSYNVIAGAPPVTPPGGSFTYEVTTNVNAGDEFYLRVYKPSGLTGVALQELFNNTTVEMTSEIDGTLSVGEVAQNNSEFIVKDDTIKFYNYDNLNSVNVFGLDGKTLITISGKETVENIDISHLNQGVYILNIVDNFQHTAYKFVKP